MIGRGQSYPPGSRISGDGTNFSLYSRAATRSYAAVLLISPLIGAGPAALFVRLAHL
jgi:hypothetical protein